MHKDLDWSHGQKKKKNPKQIFWRPNEPLTRILNLKKKKKKQKKTSKKKKPNRLKNVSSNKCEHRRRLAQLWCAVEQTNVSNVMVWLPLRYLWEMVLKLFHIKYISNCALRRDCIICSNRCSQFRPYMAAVSRGTETLYRAASAFMCNFFTACTECVCVHWASGKTSICQQEQVTKIVFHHIDVLRFPFPIHRSVMKGKEQGELAY